MFVGMGPTDQAMQITRLVLEAADADRDVIGLADSWSCRRWTRRRQSGWPLQLQTNLLTNLLAVAGS